MHLVLHVAIICQVDLKKIVLKFDNMWTEKIYPNI